MADKNKTISDLRDRIRQITDRPAVADPNRVRTVPDEIESLIPGVTIQTPFGKCWRVESIYPLGDFHGDQRIREVFETGHEPLSQIDNHPIPKNLQLSGTLFLDTETTGLSAAAGDFAFMIGVGFFTKDALVVHQLFARDHGEEPAALHAILDYARESTHLITFNGRAFDVPLLDARLATHRFSDHLSSMHHIDLLVGARRLWKYSDHGCSLGALESNVLGFRRVGDIPGFEIPGLYADYLRSRNAKKLRTVFTHNAYDVVSLAVLIARMGKILLRKNDLPLTCEEILALARITQLSGDSDQALMQFEQSLPGLSGQNLLFALGQTAKLHGDARRYSAKAMALEKLISHKPEKLSPYTKLAIVYEHHLVDYDAALSVIEQAEKNVVFANWGKKQKWAKRKARVIEKRSTSDQTPKR